MKIATIDYHEFEAAYLAGSEAKAPIEGIEERCEAVNALVIEMQQPGDHLEVSNRALSRFRALVLRHGGPEMQLQHCQIVAHAMVIIAGKWANRLLEMQLERARQALRDQGIEPVA